MHGRRRADHGARTSADSCNRHGRGGSGRRSPCSRAILVLVVDEQADGGAQGDTFVHAGEDQRPVRFPALRDVHRSARAPPVQIGLQIGFLQGQARGAAVHNAAVGRPMTFPEGGHDKGIAEGVTGHGGYSSG